MNPKISILVFLVIISTFCHSASAQTWEQLYKSADSLYNINYGTAMSSGLEKATMSLQAAETQFGKTDTNVALVLDLIAKILSNGSMARPREALPYAERALAIRETLLGPEHVEVANTLDLVAGIKISTGKKPEGILLRTQALAIYEKAHATETANYATVLHNMANDYQNRGDFSKAGAMYGRALEIKRKILPVGDPNLAYTLTMFAMNYLAQGFYNESEELLKEALQNWRQFYGPENAMTAVCIGNLAGLYETQGKFQEAEPMERKMLSIWKKELLPDDPFLGKGYLALGILLRQQAKYSEAVDTLKKGIEAWRLCKQPQFELVAWAMREIGHCHLAQHDYVQAQSDFCFAIDVQDSAANTDVTSTTNAVLGLAKVYTRTGRFNLADSMFAFALKSREKLLGPENPDVAEVLEAYTEYYRLIGDLREALVASYRAVDIRSKNFLRNARMMSEKDALSFSMFLRRSVNNYLSSVVDSRLSGAAAGNQAADIIVSTKGLTTEQAIARRKDLVTETDSATLVLAEAYRYTRFQLSTLYVEGIGKMKPEQFRRQKDSLENAANELEASLARRSRSFAAAQHEQNVSVDEIVSHLPRASTLVEYLKINYVKLNPDTLIPRYIALIVNAGGQSRIVDLGVADKIDNAIERYQLHFGGMAKLSKAAGPEEEVEYKAIATRLYKLLWRPLESSIKEHATIFLAPDGGLNLVSFAGLIGKDGRYMAEQHPLHFLSAGRDVLRWKDSSTSATGLLAFGDPDYDATVAERMASAPQLAAKLMSINPYQVRNLRSGCELLNEMTVTRLYNTRSEVEAVTNFWKEGNNTEFAQALVGSQASEEQFKRESLGKRIIHLATHGYFLQSSCMPTTSDNTVVGENPLLQSGFLLAGANLHGRGAKETGAEDGIVTALEVATMDLRGTELVVLSACETGLGKVEQGEGVYGLRRAFQMAGARTVVSSLWQVPDDETMKFMKTLYSTEARTYPELLQKVALQRIKELRLRGRPTHPYTWGAFVATGDWRIIQ